MEYGVLEALEPLFKIWDEIEQYSPPSSPVKQPKKRRRTLALSDDALPATAGPPTPSGDGLPTATGPLPELPDAWAPTPDVINAAKMFDLNSPLTLIVHLAVSHCLQSLYSKTLTIVAGRIPVWKRCYFQGQTRTFI